VVIEPVVPSEVAEVVPTLPVVPGEVVPELPVGPLVVPPAAEAPIDVPMVVPPLELLGDGLLSVPPEQAARESAPAARSAPRIVLRMCESPLKFLIGKLCRSRAEGFAHHRAQEWARRYPPGAEGGPALEPAVLDPPETPCYLRRPRGPGAMEPASRALKSVLDI
jgi:hypothetical protein